MIKNGVQKFGKFLSGMVMPNIGAFIAWGFITAFFIATGWFPNPELAKMVDPMLKYLLPLLIGITGGKIIGGDRGGVIAGIAVLGVIAGSDITMFIGAMAMGPLAGWVIKKFDKAVDGKIPAGFEMLINNFSIGILGMILAILGYLAVGPVVSTITVALETVVKAIMARNLLPVLAIFIEPAKVLFLNNALNHGVFSTIGANEVAEVGKSIIFMLEANPGPGLGVLLAYCFFAKGSAKDSAPGAVIIHFFGGIHEIYFPYVLMNPVVLIAPICGSAAAILFYSITGAGLVGAASPGSVIAFLAMAPKGQTFIVLLGIVIAAAVSFVVASPIVKIASARGKEQDLDAATSKMKEMKAVTTVKKDKINKIVFSCDAGMGSSAMGATKFRNRIKHLNLGITVINTSVDNVPPDADIVVCQVVLADRAKKSAPNAELVTIENFLQDKNLDALYGTIENIAKNGGASAPAKEEQSKEESKPKVSSDSIMGINSIKVGLPTVSKQEAIQEAGKLLHELGYVDADYIPAMLKREEVATTYMGMGVAIPHGTNDAKEAVKKTGIVVLQYPEGIDFGEEKAYLLFGIAGVGDEHLDMLAKIGGVIEEEDKLELLRTSKNKEEILALFQ